jgi:gliding motility-associated-like protein
MKITVFRFPLTILLCFLVLCQSKNLQAQSSLYMPAATNWVAVGDLDVAGTQLTVEALIYYTGASVDIVSKHTNPGDVNYLLRIGSFEISTSSGFAAFGGVAAAGVSIVPNRMYHVAATYDGAMLKYYVNGCLTGQMAWTGTMIQSNLVTAIGNMSTCQCEQFTGYIDEVRIWNVARTQAQISANMINLPSPTTQPGLLGYWKFDGSFTNMQGNPAFDGVAMGAPQFQQIPLPYPSSLHESVTSSNPICNGDPGGLINVSATGYYTPYEYSLDGITYGTSPVFSGLSAGNYTVYTRPQNNSGCAVSSSVTITDPPVLNPNLTSSNVTCNGANNGTAAVAPSGGDGPTYHQLWQPSLSTATSLSGLAPGNYSVTVIDTCRASGPELVTNGHFEDGNTGFTSGYNCCTGGPGNYAVDVDPSYYNGGHSGSGYGGGGNYLIGDGSTVAGTSLWCQSIPVTPNTYYTLSAFVASNYTTALAVVEFDINGISAGTVNAPATTFTWDPFQTVWFSGASTSANICIIDQNTIGGGNDFGIDNISFKSCASCTATAPFTITEPPALTAAISAQTNISCNGGTGSATVTANGGTPGYTYSWNSAPVQTGATASNLAAGTYTVTVTDLNLCTATATVTITEPPALTVSITAQTNISCNGGSNGSATAAGNGGAPGYTYSWNTTPAQSGTSATNLTAGTYTVTITDLNSCTSTATVTVTEPTALGVSISAQTNVSCNGGSNGDATSLANGGSPAYSYSWNTSPVQLTATASNLTAGTYTVTVSDQNSCSSTATVTITEPTGMSISISSQNNVSCNGGSNGDATALVNGGAPAYAYSWNTSPVQLTATASNLAAGTYTVTATDANSCSVTTTATITEPIVLSLSLDTKTNPSCNGTSTGSIYTLASGGTGAYTFAWTPNVSTADSAVSIAAGSYTITVTDANSCSATLTEVITDPPLLTVNAGPDVSICRGLTTNLNASAGGGTAAYSYSWSNGPVTASQTVQPLTTTNYTISISDAMNCTATDSVLVTVFQPAVISLGNDTAICQGDVLTLDAGFGFSSYTWHNGTTAQTLNASFPDMYFVTGIDPNGCIVKDTIVVNVNPLPVIGLADTLRICPGTSAILTANPGYTGYAWNTGAVTNSITVNSPGLDKVIVQDANGCINADSTVVLFHPIPQLQFAVLPLKGCDPLYVSTQNTSILNGSVIQSWDWQIGPNHLTDMVPVTVLNGAGLYNVSLQATTDNGCVVDTLLTNYIEVYPAPQAIIVPEALEYELYDDNMNISNQSIQSDFYTWSLYGDSLTNTLDFVYPITDTGAYYFQLLAVNLYGCRDSAQVMITVNPSFAIFFPDAFTPNDNGNNDKYMPKGYGIKEYELLIFDRWGNMVFKSNDMTVGWDGTYKNNLPFRDVYVYKCRIRDIKGDPHYYYGHITLVQ